MDSREKEGGKIEEERSHFVAFLMLNSYFKLNDGVGVGVRGASVQSFDCV